MAGELPQRILCLGVTGSGKSTLARDIAGILDLPVHYVDEEFGWLPGWVERDVGEQKRLALAAAVADRWVFDSAYRHYRHELIQRAELVICLDYPRMVSLGRLLGRTVWRIVRREPMCNDNVETWQRALGSDSILRWHFKSFPAKRRQMRELEARLGPDRVIRLESPKDTRAWLASLEASRRT
ncbi:adenylate kinase [Paeniglutamicibacter sp.]|uniref:adenylate kinase n=1 Tax=Paeniglutamicibacter sp. TaxID=1934391 RepID=UPI00398A3273